MILMQHHRDVGVRLDRSQHHVPQVGLAGVFARPGRGLQDHRRLRFLRGLHDGLDLLEIVDVEGRHAVAVFGGMVEYLSQ